MTPACGRRSALLAGAALVALALGAWTAWRVTNIPDADDRAREASRLLEEGRDAYRRVEMLPVESFAGAADVRRALDAMTIRGDLALNAAERDAMLAHLAGFVYYRFVQPDPEAYIRWRREEGYTLRDADAMAMLGMEAIHRQAFDRPPENGATVDQVFRALLAAERPRDTAAWRATRLPAAALGMACVAGTITLDRMQRAPVSGEMPADLWQGRVGGAVPNWFRRGRSIDELLRSEPGVEYADAGLVVEFADGSRRPLVVTLIRDPGDGRWRIEYLLVWNYPLERLTPFVF